MTSNSATERLRELLNERGVKYETEDRPTIRYTEWGDWVFAEPLDAKPHTLGAQCELMRIPATPEQAVAATLGSGTCTLPETRVDHGSIEYNGVTEWRKCSACGEEVLSYPAHYCPNCGRKVVGDVLRTE